MNGYLLGIIGTVLLSSVLTVLCPSGKTAGVIKGITRLACVIAIIAPIPGFLSSNEIFDTNSEKNVSETVIQTDSSFIKYYCETRIQNAEIALEAELLEKYALQADTQISWRFQEENVYDTDKILITKITVSPKKAIKEEEKQAVWEYLTKNYCSEVLIE